MEQILILFGLIFAFLLSYGIIEIIYNFDIRYAFCYKKQILICAVLSLIIAGVFRFDIFGYDSYIPKEDKIESMSVAISEIDDDSNYYLAESKYDDKIIY